MTWQKVNAVKASKDAQFRVAEDEPNPEEMGVAQADSPGMDIKINGLHLELESKSGNVYEFSVLSDASVDVDRMTEDMIDAASDGAELWVDVDFDGNGGDGRVLYWAEGAPWEGGDVRDNYGISEGI